jgi:hypothetical protein
MSKSATESAISQELYKVAVQHIEKAMIENLYTFTCKFDTLKQLTDEKEMKAVKGKEHKKWTTITTDVKQYIAHILSGVKDEVLLNIEKDSVDSIESLIEEIKDGSCGCSMLDFIHEVAKIGDCSDVDDFAIVVLMEKIFGTMKTTEIKRTVIADLSKFMKICGVFIGDFALETGKTTNKSMFLNVLRTLNFVTKGRLACEHFDDIRDCLREKKLKATKKDDKKPIAGKTTGKGKKKNSKTDKKADKEKDKEKGKDDEKTDKKADKEKDKKADKEKDKKADKEKDKKADKEKDKKADKEKDKKADKEKDKEKDEKKPAEEDESDTTECGTSEDNSSEDDSSEDEKMNTLLGGVK